MGTAIPSALLAATELMFGPTG